MTEGSTRLSQVLQKLSEAAGLALKRAARVMRAVVSGSRSDSTVRATEISSSSSDTCVQQSRSQLLQSRLAQYRPIYLSKRGSCSSEKLRLPWQHKVE